jgi:hypothetical protein
MEDSSSGHQVSALLTPESVQRLLGEVAASSPWLLHAALEDRTVSRIVESLHDALAQEQQAPRSGLCMKMADDGRTCWLPASHVEAGVPHGWETADD